jgi:thiol-disulfide isomerase/thioredoxin
MQLLQSRTARRGLDVLLWGVVLTLLAWRVGPQAAAALGVGAPDSDAPALAVTTLDGDEVSRAGLRGQVVLVNFWATWCPPCRMEMPGFQRVRDSRRERGLVVLGLSNERGAEPGVRAFLGERGITYPVAVTGPEAAEAFGGVRALPTSILPDRRGRVRHRVEGFFAEPALRQAVDRLLAESAPAVGLEGGR